MPITKPFILRYAASSTILRRKKRLSSQVSRATFPPPTLRLAGGSAGIVLLLVMWFVAVGPMAEALYAHGVWPRPGAEAVQDWLTRRTRPGDFRASNRSRNLSCDGQR